MTVWRGSTATVSFRDSVAPDREGVAVYVHGVPHQRAVDECQANAFTLADDQRLVGIVRAAVDAPVVAHHAAGQLEPVLDVDLAARQPYLFGRAQVAVPEGASRRSH